MALKGITRALDVLAHIAVSPGRASEIADRMGVAWATMHRTLSQLEKGGFLRREPDTNRYVIGQKMWMIGSAYIANHPTFNQALPYLSDAVIRSQAIVQFVERVDYSAIALFTQSATHELLPMTTLGYAIPLHAGSKGQVLLAFAEPAFIDDYLSRPLPKLTPKTIVDPGELRDRLAEIRAAGYSETEADVQVFTRSVAAPVFDRTGQAVAAVSFIEMRSDTAAAGRRPKQIELVCSVANAISSALDWRPGSRWATAGA
jgi:DNA-binding IclR family transcriptional regulator